MKSQLVFSNPFGSNLVAARVLVLLGALVAAACDSEPPSNPFFGLAEPRSSEPDVVGLTASSRETWIVTADGDVQGWGERYCDSTGCSAPDEIPWVSLSGTAAEVKSNGGLTAVRMNDGTVVTWQGGSGAPTPVPLQLQTGELVKGLAVGSDVLCLWFTSGDARCESLGSSQSPAALASSTLRGTVIDLSAGREHACALLDSGQVQCWGRNDYGQLGSSSASGVTTIELTAAAMAVFAGADHSCALLTSGKVQCWGRNDEGQLGHTSHGVDTVPLPDFAVSLAVGAQHGCAVTTPAGDLYCWGDDDEGQLGGGDDVGTLRQVDLGNSTALEVFGGSTASTTFARLDHGGIRGWGLDDVGQMGYGDLLGPNAGPTWDVGTLPDIDIYDGPDEGE